MSVNRLGNWETVISLDEGLYHYGFLIDGTYRIIDNASHPAYVLDNGRAISSVSVEKGIVKKINRESSTIDVKSIEMYAGNSSIIRPNKRFNNSDEEIGITINFSHALGLHAVSYLWTDPYGRLAFVSEFIIWNDPDNKSSHQLNFSKGLIIKPAQGLPVGKWVAHVLINGKLLETLEFSIQNSIYKLEDGKVIAR